MKSFKYLILIVLGFALGCTNLEEELNDDLTKAGADEFYAKSPPDVNILLRAAYDGLRTFQHEARFWSMTQHSTDEMVGPTRGPDWDDNGAWRVLHTHKWTADHANLSVSFNELLQLVFVTTNILTFNPSAQQEAESRFIRAFAVFAVADGWGQVPFRNPGDNLLSAPTVMNSVEAVDFVISEINDIINDLPAGPVHRANKDAARVLLMKAHLNRGTFATRQSPTFSAEDMAQVITNADAIINNGAYSLDNNYFENFAPNNNAVSSENIWTGENVGGTSSGRVFSRWFSTLHYNQDPSGWNGFTTLSEFYDAFEAGDVRRSADYPGMTDVSGLKAGLLVGQQYDENGVELKDRKGNQLAFTPEVSLIETGNNLEITGIRVLKYPVDFANGSGNVENDYVFFRYADVLLMKAEALLRTNNAGAALTIVNDLRAVRNASSLGSLTSDELLAERGRELYWEGWRRQDLIRFGKYLEPWQLKEASGPERLLFPIPAIALSVNPNLEQNPGY